MSNLVFISNLKIALKGRHLFLSILIVILFTFNIDIDIVNIDIDIVNIDIHFVNIYIDFALVNIFTFTSLSSIL